ncbi:hypothetical protein [Isoptericola sediminis]|uniref:Uncharacterized protein n=1 Tax=Isoptericola sediminis TaxID=2733572 RepID=A0A849K0W5_9MICO|nr:hypothetical protein [Isoptericola sediminis]NNU26788.1 hypothetical protein [Isoptericola sediminis]
MTAESSKNENDVGSSVTSFYGDSLSHQAHVDETAGVGVVVRPGAATRDAWDLGGGLLPDSHRSTREEDLSRLMAKLAELGIYISPDRPVLGHVVDLHGHRDADELILVCRPDVDHDDDQTRARVERIVLGIQRDRAS